ncbi:hypothetical protein E2C01_050747 [Portunus trituberculatus]|uniref:Uncharacterized protein n=1 Tax=Portunus trituberculatus TaxID=210409 RepID=A0A5B7G9S7_PORTR|nr:hypothetical protein [Portunus trituberculatus]
MATLPNGRGGQPPALPSLPPMISWPRFVWLCTGTVNKAWRLTRPPTPPYSTYVKKARSAPSSE